MDWDTVEPHTRALRAQRVLQLRAVGMDNESVSRLPASLRAFLHSCIESIEQVEVLMLLRGANQPYSVRDVSTILRVPGATARKDLETLAARGLLDVRVGDETTYVYRPKSEELGRHADALAEY